MLEMLVSKKKLDVNSQEFQSLSANAKNLLLQLLSHNPIQRISAKEALDHNFFATEGQFLISKHKIHVLQRWNTFDCGASSNNSKR